MLREHPKSIAARDLPALVDLRKLVVDAAIGAEWMTDAQNLRFAEELYGAGELH